MMTPVTPEQAREIAADLILESRGEAAIHSLADQVEALTAERDEWKARCEFSFEQRDKLTAERDEWVAKHKECTKLLGEALQDSADMAVERDAYAEAADSMAAAHKVERDWLTAKLNQQASMVEKCMVAINANADIGEQAEFRAAEFEQLYDDEAIVAKTYESHITELKEKNETLIAELAAIRADMVAERDALKDAARLALGALTTAHINVNDDMLADEIQQVIAALKAVL